MKARSVAATLALSTVVIAGSVAPASASSIPYRSWTHDRHNCAGIVFHPYGDWFEGYQNLPGWHIIRFYWAYYPSGQWHFGGWNNYDHRHRWHPHNFAEHHQIKFYVVGDDCSSAAPVVRHSTT